MAHTECEELVGLLGYRVTPTAQIKEEIVKGVEDLLIGKMVQLPDPETHQEKIDRILLYIKKELREY
jgi:hypothetical protein